VHEASALYRLLGDDARLRLLRLLALDRLNVTELTGILGLAQSGVSRHLGLLKDGGLVSEEREAGFTYYRISPAVCDGSNGPSTGLGTGPSTGLGTGPSTGLGAGPSTGLGAGPSTGLGAGPSTGLGAGHAALWRLLQDQFDRASATDVGRADSARLEEVRRLRKENFETHGSPDTNERQLVPGRSWAAWARALGHLLPPVVVADLGCGEGYLTVETSRWASRVIAVDRSAEVLKRARALATRRRVSNVTWKRGELETLPIRDETVDVALFSQALHHADDPSRALQEAVRILVPGGRVLLLDLREHGETWVRARLGDQWLGFTREGLAALLEGAGLAGVKVNVGARRTGDPFTVLIASGVKPVKAQKQKLHG
jgi:SAM-dependent methyltransferase